MRRRSFLEITAAASAAPLISLPQTAQAQTLNPVSRVRVTELRTYKLKDALFVKVTADNGQTGWGESSPNNRHVVETFIHHGLKEHVIGRNVWDAEPIWDDMFFANHDLGPDGVLPYAIAGIDTALWDLRGKLVSQPACVLLGGRYRDKVRAYGSFGLGLGTDKPLTQAEAAKTAARLVERGFTAIKARTQFRERQINPWPDPTFDYFRALRQAVGDRIELLACLNSSYTAARAIELGRRLHGELGISYIEEAVSTHNLHELAQVCEALPFPVIAGETEYHRWRMRDLIDLGHVGMLNPDVIKCGGLTEVKKIAALAQACSRPLKLHNTRPAISTAAALHLLASISNAGPFVEYPDTGKFRAQLALFHNQIEFKNGFLHVPARPGLGLDIDEEAVRRASQEASATK
ncbi:MAG: mandelate racemase/muconate lactonizing enzyme family protein [Blastocatellia bacterium]